MIGKTLGHYRIESELAAGGMGVVYRARDTRLERTVAIKFIGERFLADEGARERLLREARLASALNHPHICTIYEVGEADGQPFIAMEYVEGKPLSSLVPGDGLPVETLLRYGTQMADALAHAHERGVVHRDLKTSNVVITPEGRSKVLDFGLAVRESGDQLVEATRSRVPLAEAGTIAGTLSYMAPEVLRGESPDARADIWALGVLLYEMAAGALPFQGRTGYELTAAILREPPAPLPPRVPAGLRAIVLRCLAKEPGQRYQRAGEIRAALETLHSDTTIAPAVATPVHTRRRWLWPVAAGLLLIGGGIWFAVIRGIPFTIGVTRIESPQAPAEPRLSNGGRPSSNPEANEYFEKALLFMGWGHFDLPKARQMLERALELDPHFAAARAEYGFTHLLMINSGYSNDTSWPYKAEEELRRALQEDPHSARVHAALAAVYLNQGRKELVPGEVEKALKLDPDMLDAQIWLLNYYQLNGDRAAAQAVAKQVLERNPVFWPARMNLGDILRQQGDMAGAIREQEKVLEQDPQNIYAISLLARVYMDMGELGKARAILERGRPEDRRNYRTRSIWALLYVLEGKRKEAFKEMDVELLKYLAASVSTTVEAAEFYAVLGESDQALEWLDRAVRNGDDRADWFQRDPFLANIRNEPRFKQILDSIAYRRAQRSPSPSQPTK